MEKEKLSWVAGANTSLLIRRHSPAAVRRIPMVPATSCVAFFQVEPLSVIKSSTASSRMASRQPAAFSRICSRWAAGETDQETGLGNRALLARLARQRLSDKNRMLYVMFCFRLDQQRLRGPEDGERTALLQHIASVLQSFSSDADIAARVSDNGFAVLRLCAGREEWELWIAALMERLRECGTCPMAAGVCPLKAEDRELDGAIYRGMQAAGAALERGEAYLLYSDRAAASFQEE